MLGFKQIETKDVPALAALYVSAFNAPPWNEQWTQETAERRLYQMVSVEEFYGLAAFQDGALCGLILGCFEQFYHCMSFSIREFCVRNELRGQGIGTEIYERFESDLKCLGVEEFLLYTYKGGGTERFYRERGFSNIDRLTLMGKKL